VQSEKRGKKMQNDQNPFYLKIPILYYQERGSTENLLRLVRQEVKKKSPILLLLRRCR